MQYFVDFSPLAQILLVKKQVPSVSQGGAAAKIKHCVDYIHGWLQ